MSFHKFSDLLGQLSKRFPGLKQRLGEASSVARWDTAVGPAIAKHARALRVEKGVLWVEVDHPLWKTELHLRKRQILEKLAVNENGPGEASITDLFLIDLKPDYARARSSLLPQDRQEQPNQNHEQKNPSKGFSKR